MRASYCYNGFRMRSSIIRSAKQSSTAQAAGGNVMDDVYKMYAMSDGEGDAEPAEVDHDEDMDDEDEEGKDE